MSITFNLIEHTNTQEKFRFLRVLDLLSVYEPKGFIKKILDVEFEYYNQHSTFETPFHIVAAYTEFGALVGYAFYYTEEKTCEFYVLPHWRGKNVGSGLVDQIRKAWSGTSVLSAYRGFQGWANFFERNFILELDQFEFAKQEDIDKYGSMGAARKVLKRNAKLAMAGRMARARREALRVTEVSA